MKLSTAILHELQNVRIPEPVNKEIFRNQGSIKKNEFLFILKPEVFAKTKPEELESILELIQERLTKYNFSIDNVRLINAAYLDHFQVIAQHYGVINAASRNFWANITDEIKSNFNGIYNRELAGSKVFGSLELVSKFPEITDAILQKLWSNCEIKRLAGGVYCGEVEFQGEQLFIINGFHPPQIEHFIAENRVIATMNLSCDIDWEKARKEFTGNTYPEKAEKGTLRRDIFDQYGKLGFDDVSYVINSLHLSAGPVEGLLELKRFNSEFDRQSESSFSDFGFGKMLEVNFSGADFEKIVSNSTVNYQGKQISIFDLTEEMNSLDAIELLKNVLV